MCWLSTKYSVVSANKLRSVQKVLVPLLKLNTFTHMTYNERCHWMNIKPISFNQSSTSQNEQWGRSHSTDKWPAQVPPTGGRREKNLWSLCYGVKSCWSGLTNLGCPPHQSQLLRQVSALDNIHTSNCGSFPLSPSPHQQDALHAWLALGACLTYINAQAYTQGLFNY